MCKICGGYGFYTEILLDGNHQGRVCNHKTGADFVLKQDKTNESPSTRSHNKVHIRVVA